MSWARTNRPAMSSGRVAWRTSSSGTAGGWWCLGRGILLEMQMLCRTVHAAITVQTRSGCIRISPWRQWNLNKIRKITSISSLYIFLCIFKGCILLMVYLRLRTPIHLSTTDLVAECMVLHLRSWSVVGAISGVISHRFSGYPLSPRSSPLHLWK